MKLVKLKNTRHKFFFYVSVKTFEEQKTRMGNKFPWAGYYEIVSKNAGEFNDEDLSELNDIKESPDSMDILQKSWTEDNDLQKLKKEK